MKEPMLCLSGLTMVACLLLTGCGGKEADLPVVTQNPLYVDPASRDFSDNPALLERILASPHGYLRFINIPFSSEVCRRAGHLLDGVPLFNLHGDAHIEQYAVTDLGRGLTDFDDSSKGPAAIDLVRLGVSLRVASGMRGWQSQADGIFDRFIAGYRSGLEDPETEVPVPAVADRLAADFSYDRKEYFEWVESIVEPVPPSEAERLAEALASYVDLMLEQHPELEPSYFQITDLGYLRLGIGSALDRKYLVRVRGVTDDPGDDVVLELKQVRDLKAIDCISVGRGTEPLRILIGQSRIAYQPYGLLGYVRFDGLTFWVHAWVDNYAEASITETFQSPAEMAEVAFDVGVQLGRGHPNQIGADLDLQVRRELMRLLDRDEEQIREISRDLAVQVVEAWEAFRASIS